MGDRLDDKSDRYVGGFESLLNKLFIPLDQKQEPNIQYCLAIYTPILKQHCKMKIGYPPRSRKENLANIDGFSTIYNERLIKDN